MRAGSALVVERWSLSAGLSEHASRSRPTRSDPCPKGRKGRTSSMTGSISRYAKVHGLNLYYEIHGEGGHPLVLLHGALSAIGTSFGRVLPELARQRQVIAVEMQGHGRTADIDRPLRYELLADDIAALLAQVGIDKADLFGWSLGAGVALQTAIRHPERVRKQVLASVTYNSAGLYPELLAGIAQAKAEDMVGTQFYEEYRRIAADPQDFPRLFARQQELDGQTQDWPVEAIG